MLGRLRQGGTQSIIPCQVCLLSRFSSLLTCVDCLEVEEHSFVPIRTRWKTKRQWTRCLGLKLPGFAFKIRLSRNNGTNTFPLAAPRWLPVLQGRSVQYRKILLWLAQAESRRVKLQSTALDVVSFDYSYVWLTQKPKLRDCVWHYLPCHCRPCSALNDETKKTSHKTGALIDRPRCVQ